MRSAGLNAHRDAATKLSYRYDRARKRWVRTGDLPEVQGWVGTPALRLADGRLLITGGTLTGPARVAARIAPGLQLQPAALDDRVVEEGLPFVEQLNGLGH